MGMASHINFFFPDDAVLALQHSIIGTMQLSKQVLSRALSPAFLELATFNGLYNKKAQFRIIKAQISSLAIQGNLIQVVIG